MSDTNDARGAHHRPHPQAMNQTYLEFDLDREITGLMSEPGWQTGQNAKTLVKYDDLRVVVTAMRQGARMAEHRASGRVTIHTVRGHVHVHALGRTFDLRSGQVLALDRGVPHDVEALDDSAILLSIAWPGAGA